jgi:hypothetical protein
MRTVSPDIPSWQHQAVAVEPLAHTGALAALPILDSHTAIKRIWLKPFLQGGVSEKHQQQKDPAFGDKA